MRLLLSWRRWKEAIQSQKPLDPPDVNFVLRMNQSLPGATFFTLRKWRRARLGVRLL